MAIHYSTDQWETFKETHRKWWAGSLERPLLPVTISNHTDRGSEPDIPSAGQHNCHDFSITPEQVIERADWELSGFTFLGDSCPVFNLTHFGPGVIAAFLGCELDNSTGQVWFHPKQKWELKDLHLTFNPDNKWFQRIAAICQAGIDRWQGEVLIAMTDLGGNLDILSSFLPGEQLLLALIDEPDEVERLVWEAHEAWHAYFNAINEILHPVNPGYSSWSRIFCEDPTYILQCDFSYMISPDMFKQFVLPELEATCRRLTHSFYHLDGIGQLPHLPILLESPVIDGIQWVPGAGKPLHDKWPEVYRSINEAGRLYQVNGGLEIITTIEEQIGNTRGMTTSYLQYNADEEERAYQVLDHYNISY